MIWLKKDRCSSFPWVPDETLLVWGVFDCLLGYGLRLSEFGLGPRNLNESIHTASIVGYVSYDCLFRRKPVTMAIIWCRYSMLCFIRLIAYGYMRQRAMTPFGPLYHHLSSASAKWHPNWKSGTKISIPKNLQTQTTAWTLNQPSLSQWFWHRFDESSRFRPWRLGGKGKERPRALLQPGSESAREVENMEPDVYIVDVLIRCHQKL